ncbi:ribbon-helix-helix domain-containing protein [candidate division CSSED10-310 bacterium]|uniref:Ribbon-helix-helix domain-containing protein n=1 Tax=candidate division CSSED10-310 bacterium TaxID=2855610 RepID=A0ABV6Z067_UNCC1
MKTIQMTIDDELLQMIDRITQRKKTSRSAFIREAVKKYLHRLDIEELELKHKAGYCSIPVKEGEFDIWEDEQIWEDK